MVLDIRHNKLTYRGRGGQKGLFVPDAGWEQTLPSHMYASVRDYYLFHFVLSGKGRYYLEDKAYSLSKNYGFLIEPGVETRYEADAYEPWEYCWIGVRGLDVIDFLESAELYNKHYFSFEPEYIEPLLQLLEGLKDGSRVNPDYINLKINAVFLEIMACFVPQISRKSVKTVNSLALEGATFFKKHFSENIGVNEAAAALSVSRVYFSTLFRKETGMTPKEYLTGLRFDHAKKLLADEKRPIASIAEACGFTDPAMFSKSFKKAFGVTPLTYRKSIP